MIFRFQILTYLCFVFTSIIFATNNYESQLSQGIELSFNFEFEEAENIFNQLINNFPEDPRSYHYKSSIYLWKYASDKKDSDFNIFFDLSDMTLDKCEKLLDKNDKNKSALFVLGSNYGLRAIAYLKAEESLNSVLAVKKAKSNLSKLKSIDPQNYDANLGIGLFDYSLSFTPGFFKWALKIAGLSGDRKGGIKKLKLAYKNSEKTKTEAAYYLSQVYSESIINYNKAFNYILTIANKYPNNELFNYSKAVLLIKLKNLEDAKKILINLVNSKTELEQIKSFSLFLLGDISFKQNDFIEAVTYYKKFLLSSNTIDYSGIAYFRLALSSKFLKDESNYQKYMNLAVNGNEEIPDDHYAKDKSLYFIKNGIDAIDLQLIKINNFIESNNYPKANDLLLEISKLNDLNNKIWYNYLNGIYFYSIGNYSNSFKYFTEIIESKNIEVDRWMIPYSFYYLAKICLNINKFQDAEHYLNEAYKFDNYNYKKTLHGLIEGLKDSNENI